MNDANSFLMSLFPLIFMAIIALVLIACGTSVVKHPTILSNYHSFTEEEKSSPAFQRYLKSVRTGMVTTGVLLVAGQLLATVSGSQLFITVSLLLTFIVPFYIFYYQGKVSARMKRKSYIYAGFCGVILLGLVVIPIMRGNSFSYENETLYIHGMYGDEIPRSEMCSVLLEDSLPAIAFRSNGFSLGNVHKGYFRTVDGRTVKLFLSSSKAPYLHICVKGENDVYLNSSDAKEMKGLYLLMMGEKDSLR